MGYAMKNDKLLCLDAGHFHPTEVISDKITSTLMFLDEILLHVSRGVRWDSDHVVTMTEELRAIAEEIVRHNYDRRVHIGLDYFDASINRVMAWTIGARNMYKALLMALTEPAAIIRKAEKSGDKSSRLALDGRGQNSPVRRALGRVLPPPQRSRSELDRRGEKPTKKRFLPNADKPGSKGPRGSGIFGSLVR